MIGKRDKDFRPTIIVQANRLIGKLEEYSEEELCACVAFTISYAIDNLLIPGKVENLNLLFDATDLSVLNFSLTLLKNVCTVCLNGFPTRINRTFIVGLGYFVRKVYKAFYYFLPEFTRNAIIVVEDVKKEMSEWYDMRNVMTLYGGILPNKTINFFPPDMSMYGQTMLSQSEVAEIIKKDQEPRSHSFDTADSSTVNTSNKSSLIEESKNFETE